MTVLPESCADVCPRCVHHSTCRTPCYPVSLYLARENLTVYERTETNEKGETVSIIYSRSREIPESDLLMRFEDGSISADKAQRVFNTENESPFASFNPRLKQTGVFVDRFFHGFSYRDLATKYDVSKHNAMKIYYAAVKRVLEILEKLDGEDAPRNLEHWKKQVEERSGSLPKGQKWFLLNKLFGFRPSEIAEMEGLNGSSAVRQLIIRVSDQLKCGEIRLIDATPEEAEEAKKRLEARRDKRREQYSTKKRKG